MNPVLAFAKLIRWLNILIIICTQYSMHWFIISPMLEINGFSSQISEGLFFLLCLSTVLIAAAGYTINDYFDIKTDMINKPEKIIVGKHIKRRVAMGAHIVMNVLGLLIGLYASWKVGSYKLVSIHLFSAISLWYYATYFKHGPFIGNLIISILAALVPLIVGLFEIPPLYAKYAVELKTYNFNFNYISYWIIAYSGFAFLLTYSREITKDLADMKGDATFGTKTLPLYAGIKFSKYVIISLYIIVLASIIIIQQTILAKLPDSGGELKTDWFTFAYIYLFLVIPLLYTIYKTIRAETRTDYITADRLNKAVSVAGICYSILACYLIKNGL
jgi:4-hydroxybenzoate polyprenyltransferase